MKHRTRRLSTGLITSAFFLPSASYAAPPADEAASSTPQVEETSPGETEGPAAPEPAPASEPTPSPAESEPDSGTPEGDDPADSEATASAGASAGAGFGTQSEIESSTTAEAKGAAGEGEQEDKWIDRWPPENHMVELGIYGGVWFPSRNLELFESDDSLPDQGFREYPIAGFHGGLRAGYFPIRFFGVEAEGGILPTRTKDEREPATVWTVRGHLVGQLGLWSITPFVLFGTGVMGVASDRDAFGTESDVVIHFGGGAKFFINRYVMLRLDIRDVLSNKRGVGESVTSSPEILVGLSFTLGRKKKKKARPRPGDRDGDGVYDRKDQCPDKPGPQPRGCPVVCIDDDDEDRIPNPEDKCPNEPESRNGFEDDDGCPDEVPDELKDLSGTMRGINFDTDKDTIKSNSVPVLEKALKVLQDYPDVRVEIGGHTDSRGGYEHNMDLSRRRAEAVKKWLVDKGIADARIETRGAGPNEPVDTNDSAEGRANNRRIEFKILEQKVEGQIRSGN